MRILIATVTAGAGHLQAAAALAEAWKSRRPKDEVLTLDVLDFTSKLYRKVYTETYIKLVEHAPNLWAMVFKKTDNPELVRSMHKIRRVQAKLATGKFMRAVQDFQPRAVLCSHYLPLVILGRIKSENPGPPSILSASIITDFEAHALWMEPSVDLYCVAAESTKARLAARGAPADAVVVTGIPIASKFSQPVQARNARRQLGLRDDLPVLLVLSGGFGLGPVAEILTQLNQLEKPVQVVVVCGRNETLRRDLAVQDRRHPTHVLGFVSNMHELLAVATLVITKPGGLTSSETLAMGKPMMILNPIPGQEAANSDYLLEHGAAAKVNRVEDLPFRLNQLLGSPRLGAMARAAKQLGRPGAAAHVCQAVLERLEMSGPPG